MRILIVEDDELVAQMLDRVLSEQHYTVDIAADGQAGWELVEACTYDLILLDVVLPRLDGIAFCQQLRSRGLSVPILLLTAQDNSTYKVEGLDAGADDYVTKPFDTQELLARVRALLRRGSTELPPILTWGNLKLDPSNCEVTHNHQGIPLTPKEYSLLELFLRNRHRIFSRGEILDRLWSLETFPGEDTVTSHIKGLRMKLKAANLLEDPIETIYGMGYRLKPPVTPMPQSKKTAHKANGKLEAIWQRVQEKSQTRLATIQRATQALSENHWDEDLRDAAAIAAHQLAGSLGVFDLDEGSRLAKEIERLLQGKKPIDRQQKQTLQTKVANLHACLQKAHPTDFSQPSTPERPVLSIITAKLDRARVWMREAENWGLQGAIAENTTVVREGLNTNRPDGVLLDLSKGSASESDLSLLEELNACKPPIPALVLTHQDSLRDRVKVARAGGRFFVENSLSPAQLLETVAQAIQRASRGTEATVMVVDDDLQILTTLAALLKPWGLKVVTLESPLDFLPVLEATAPDLLILDIEMPQVNGLELCQVARNDSRWAGLPILFLTAHTDAKIMKRVFEVGADDYVSKPIVEPELVTRILNRLERSRLLRNRSEIDPLTNLANRRKFSSTFNPLLQRAERYRQPCCLALLDVDGLDRINNQYGYSTGDRVLIRLGQLLQQLFLKEEIVARWGGAVFAVGMYGMTCQEGNRRVAELLDLLRRESFLPAQETPLAVTFSAGLVEYPRDGKDRSHLYRAAIQLLERAKIEGGERILAKDL
ncbi:response regulator [Lusitaniella coriacea]|uniref:response regulator n=1 Tax=Lusitaniella coriacea TaxID=1983105 RepID=UPI003CF8F582